VGRVARVSTTEQDLSGQLAALKEAGCKRVYSEKKSGANGDRAALQRQNPAMGPLASCRANNAIAPGHPERKNIQSLSKRTGLEA
jgi:hypothetical protein